MNWPRTSGRGHGSGALLFGWDVDSLYLTALLTVIGFSVQDKIVVFDRIRENSTVYRRLPFETLANHSIVQTLQRFGMPAHVAGTAVRPADLAGRATSLRVETGTAWSRPQVLAAFLNALEPLKCGLQAPEAAAAEGGDFESIGS